MDGVRNGAAWALDVRIDENQLDGEEQHELLALGAKCRAGAERGTARFDPGQLSRRELTRFEELVERAADSPGLFERRRKEAEAKVKIAELLQRARKAPPQPRYEREGSVVIPPEVFEDLEQGVIWLEDLAYFCYVLRQLATGGSMLPPRAHLEPDGVLILDRSYHLPAALDPEQRMRAKASLDNLVRAKWLARDGQRVTRGPRLLAAMKARAA